MSIRRALENLSVFVQVACPVAIGILIIRTAVNVPYWDEWEWADLVIKFHQGTLAFSDIWTQHNEHRILVPQLILLALDRFGGWSPNREIFVSLFLLVCTQIALLLVIQRTIHGTSAVVAATLTAIQLYGLWQAENLTWGFQMGLFVCNAACVTSIASLTRPQRGSFFMLLAIIAAVVASYSSSEGFLIWVAGSVAIVTSWRHVSSTLVGWLAAATITYLIYIHGLTPSTFGHVDPVQHPLQIVRYALVYLGSPLAGWGGTTLSLFTGLVAVGVVIGSAARDTRVQYVSRHCLRRGPWYALATYAMGSAFATATGRGALGLDQALVSRYTSVSGLLWIAVFCICATWIGDRRWSLMQSQRLQIVSVVGFAVCALVFVRADMSGWRDWVRIESTWATARLGLERDDPAALAILYPNDIRLLQLLNGLRRIHDGPFVNK
jgi:hypothetical protein